MSTTSLRRTALAIAVTALVAACGPSFSRDQVYIDAGVAPGGATDGGATTGGDSGGVTTGDAGTTTGELPSELGSDAVSTTGGTSGGSSTSTSGGATSTSGTSGGSTTSTSGSSTSSTSGTTSGTSGGSTTSTSGTSGGSSTGSSGVEPGDPTGVTADTIKIGYLVPETGAATIPTGWRDGAEFYWDHVNANGGVNGRNVEILIYNTNSNTSTAVNQAQTALTQDRVFTIVTLDRLEVQKAVADFMEGAKIPHIMVQSPASPPPSWSYTFTISIEHVNQGRDIATFFAQDLGAANGAKKVGFVREQTAALKPGTDAFEARAQELGLDVVARETIDPSNREFSQLVLKLSQSQADMVWLYMAPEPAANIISSAAGSGYRPTWFANSISWNFELMHTVAGLGITGAYAFSPWKPFGDPAANEFKSAWRTAKGSEPDEFGFIGWALGEVVDEALAAPGQSLGRNSFRVALQNLKVSTKLWAPIDFSGGGSLGSRAVSVWRSDGSQWVSQGDFRTFS